MLYEGTLFLKRYVARSRTSPTETARRLTILHLLAGKILKPARRSLVSHSAGPLT